MEYKYSTIVLGKRDVGETDRIYTFYTREAGKIQILARGVRKSNAKLSGQIETVTLSEIFISKNRGRGNLTSAIATDNFLEIKSNLDATRNVFWSFSVLDKLVQFDEKDEEIFDLLSLYLGEINKKSSSEILTLGFLIKLLEKLGYRLEVEKCVVCGNILKPKNNFFSAELGGVVCQNCVPPKGKRIPISENAIKLTRLFFRNNIQNFSKIKAEKKDTDNLKIAILEMTRWVIN